MHGQSDSVNLECDDLSLHSKFPSIINRENVYMRLFRYIYFGILAVFIGLMAVVATFSYSRTSGATRQDMAEAHFIRQKAVLEKRQAQPLDTISER